MTAERPPATAADSRPPQASDPVAPGSAVAVRATTEPSSSQAVVTRIRAETGFVPLQLNELWACRELIYFLVARQIKTDYRQMALGPLWLVVRPALSVVIYTLIFSKLARLPSDELPYPLFAFSAVILWTLFTSTTQGAANSLVVNQHLHAKVYFPRLVAPLVSAITCLIPFVVSFLVLLVIAAAYGFTPGWNLLLAPVYISLTAVTALAVGVTAAPWVAKYRDVGQVLDYLLLAWMYATPVVYAIDGVIPDDYQVVYRLNPLTNFVQGLRWAVFGVGDAPGLMLLTSAALALIAFFGGALSFRRHERNIVDIV
jgi:lipopolysaccharide transport system permease protein